MQPSFTASQPTQRHRWFTRGINREKVRRMNLERLALDVAVEEFDARYPTLRFPSVVVLIAAYEEEANLGPVLKGIPSLVAGQDVATLVVVDGGADRTDRVALDAGIATCVLPVNLGQGAALRLGYRLAVARGARYVVTMDADGQNDPAELERLVAPLLDDEADMVIASRQLGTDHTTDRFRQAGVRLYARVLNGLANTDLTDTSNGYRSFRSEVLEDILPHLRQNQYQTAEVLLTTAARGWRITDCPATWNPRASGESKKGGNLYFGLRYARVIASTWFRLQVRGTRRA